MVAPALAAAYLVAAPTPLRARLRHVVVAAVAFVISAGWYVVLTLLWPASSRPYIAGSTDNNFMNLVLGYNGFARVLGRNHMGFGPPNQVVGSAAGAQLHLGRYGGFGGFGDQSQGWSRLFGGEFGFEIGWLVPAALLATVLVVLSRGRAARTDLTRAAAILFGGWLVVDGVVLSFMHGMIHAYYCLSIAPPMAAMFAIGVHELWQHREKWLYRGGLAMLVGGTGVWSWWVLGRNGNLAARLAVDHPGAGARCGDRCARAVDGGNAAGGRTRCAGRWTGRRAGRTRRVCDRHDRPTPSRRRTVRRARRSRPGRAECECSARARTTRRSTRY